MKAGIFLGATVRYIGRDYRFRNALGFVQKVSNAFGLDGPAVEIECLAPTIRGAPGPKFWPPVADCEPVRPRGEGL